MSRSPSRKKAKTNGKSAPTQQGGGCFSPLAFPPILIIMCFSLFMLAFGETTDPLAMNGRSPNSSVTYSGDIAPLFTPEVQYWAKDIVQWAGQHGLDPNLAATVMQIESCGYPQARSIAGAMGLFQVMPYHFQPGESGYIPSTNALRGLGYLKQALDTYGNPNLALAGYNGGIGTAGRPQSLWPAETIRYVNWGGGIYRDAQAGHTSSPTLQAWLSAGGASLCAQAAQWQGR